MQRPGLALGLLAAALAGQAQETDLETRVHLLERRLSSRAMMEMLRQLDQLQREVQNLHGQVEEMQYRFKRLEESRRRQYLDLDARLRRLEGGTPAEPVAPAPSPPGAEPVAPAPSPPGAEPVAPPRVQTGRPAATAPEEIRQAYRQAYAKLQAGHYDAAVDAFSRFLQRHPEGELADNAWYWLGEAYYVKRDFKAARQAFQQVVGRFPASAKLPDALLKLGYVAYEEGRWQEARGFLEEVTTRFPDARAARLAAERLERMRQERRI